MNQRRNQRFYLKEGKLKRTLKAVHVSARDGWTYRVSEREYGNKRVVREEVGHRDVLKIAKIVCNFIKAGCFVVCQRRPAIP